MQLWVLGLVLGIVIHDAVAGSRTTPVLSDYELLGSFVAPKIALAVAYALLCRFTIRRLARSGGMRHLIRLDRATTLFRTGTLALYMMDLSLGSLLAVRTWLTGLLGIAAPPPDHLIVIDELLFLLPPLLLLMFSWWSYYPIERRLREASLIQRIDSGEPIHPIWTRGQYLLTQVRHQVALILVPLLFLIAWSELIDSGFVASMLPSAVWGAGGIDPRPSLQMAGAACIFLFAPVMIRHMWDTCPLPAGDLRHRLMQMCRHHRVGVRELLLWRTFGGVINAAVMGLVRPLRYILLTDALLEQLTRRQIEAVMAHELAHIRRHHTFWLLAVVATLGVILTTGWWVVLDWVDPSWAIAVMGVGRAWNPRVVDGMSLGLAIVSCLAAFGWVSRRFERQADTFAVQHLAQESNDAADAGNGVIFDGDSVSVMVSALQRVADLNHMPIGRRSWRHGSIAWRQRYLHGLIGLPATHLGVDRQVFWIKVLTSLGILATVAINQFSPS